jgi:hypothetical protein
MDRLALVVQGELEVDLLAVMEAMVGILLLIYRWARGSLPLEAEVVAVLMPV